MLSGKMGRENTMREYDSFQDACEDEDLELMIIWQCTNCGKEREERPYCNEGGKCVCGGWYENVGQSYRG